MLFCFDFFLEVVVVGVCSFSFLFTSLFFFLFFLARRGGRGAAEISLRVDIPRGC